MLGTDRWNGRRSVRRLLVLAGAVCALGLGPALAFAGPASDFVRAIYTPKLKNVATPRFRSNLTAPALAVLEKDRLLSNHGEEIGCIDWDLAIDAQDFDQEEINRTLSLSESVAGDTAEVTARFRLFADGSEPERQVVWTLKRAGEAWKIADIASVSGEWRLSELCRDGN